MKTRWPRYFYGMSSRVTGITGRSRGRGWRQVERSVIRETFRQWTASSKQATSGKEDIS